MMKVKVIQSYTIPGKSRIYKAGEIIEIEDADFSPNLHQAIHDAKKKPQKKKEDE